MEVLFASANLADWTGLPPTSTDATKFDNTRAPYCFKLFDDNDSMTMRADHQAPSSGNIVWYHFRCFQGQNSVTASEDGYMFDIYSADGDGAIIARVEMLNATLAAKVYGDTDVVGTYGVALTPGLHEWDIKMDVSASGITMTLYLDQVLYSTATTLNTGGRLRPARFKAVPVDAVYSNDYIYVSEFVVAKDDTRGLRCTRVDVASVGFHTAWDGVVANLGDDDIDTDMRTDTAAERTSAVLATYSGGDSIAAVVAVAQVTGGGAPASLKQSLRIGSTDYDGAAVSADSVVVQFQAECWELDPSDSGSWTAAKLNAAQLGLLSVA